MLMRDQQVRDVLARSNLRILHLLVRDFGPFFAVWGLVDSEDIRTRAERAIRRAVPGYVTFHLTTPHEPRFTPLSAARIHEGTAAVYTVRRGDTLREIARKCYDDPEKWELIRDANPHRIHNPECIRQGTQIVVPRA